MLPVSETIRSRSKTYSLSWATERSAYLTAPMPICGAIAARTVLGEVGPGLVDDARGRSSTASSRSAMSRSGSPDRVRRILRSLPSTLPIWTWTGATSSGSQPALRAVSQTMLRCSACGRADDVEDPVAVQLVGRGSGSSRGRCRVAVAAVGLADDERHRLALAAGVAVEEDAERAVADPSRCPCASSSSQIAASSVVVASTRRRGRRRSA